MLLPNFKRILTKKVNQSKTIKQFSYFLISGSTSNLISFLIYLITYKEFNFSIKFASLLGQVSGLTVSYAMNSRLSFKKKAGRIGKSFYSFYYFSAILFVSLSIDFLNQIGLEYRVSWFVCIAIVSVINFIVMKYVIFKS